jgi:serine/threonine protein phosphatase PrpC
VNPRSVTIARTATVIGREHVRLGRNNQDGVFALTRDDLGVAVVTDGCSSQPFSEVGARLSARVLATLVSRMDSVQLEALPIQAMDALTRWLARFVESVEGDDVVQVLEAYGLFTVLCAVQRGDQAVVFGSGDGAVVVDGRVTRLSSGEENAPAYLGYRVLGQAVPVVVHHLGPARQVALCTDGLDAWVTTGASALFDDELVWRNPVQLQRRLNVLQATERFSDDATLAILSRRAA